MFDLFEQFDYNIKIIATVLLFTVSFFIILRKSTTMSVSALEISNYYIGLISLVVAKSFGYFINYINIINYIFFILLFVNVLALFPYSLAITSYIGVTLVLSSVFLLSFFILMVIKFGLFFLANFFITGLNSVVSILLAIIESISNIVKIFSLAIRLFANIFAGHVLLKVFLSLLMLFFVEYNFAFCTATSLFILFVVFFLELFVAFLQALLFVFLLSLYSEELTIINQ